MLLEPWHSLKTLALRGYRKIFLANASYHNIHNVVKWSSVHYL